MTAPPLWTPARLAEELRAAAGRCVVFTGAGLSAASGLPTFRGADGVWVTFSPARFGRVRGLVRSFFTDFQKLGDFVVGSGRAFLAARPNPAHHALAALQAHGLVGAVVTQNVDGLETSAGVRDVVELHGSFFASRCLACGDRAKVDAAAISAYLDALDAARGGRFAFFRALRDEGIRCASCRGRTRPDMVLFGESLQAKTYEVAADAAADARLFITIGTSTHVRPASDLPYIAAQAGAVVVEIDPAETELTPIVDAAIRAPAADALVQAAAALGVSIAAAAAPRA